LKGICRSESINEEGGEIYEDFMIKPGDEDEKPFWRGFYKT
jgi:hypothetical protein